MLFDRTMIMVLIIMPFLQLTFVDFILYELLDQHKMFEPSLFDDCANLNVSY